jgi:hypothetical protein
MIACTMRPTARDRAVGTILGDLARSSMLARGVSRGNLATADECALVLLHDSASALPAGADISQHQRPPRRSGIRKLA